MFDAVRNNKKIVQIFFALITLPFAFFGVDSYVRNSGAGSDLASVGDTKITIPQFEQALRERQDQLRQQLGASFKPEMMNTPEARMSVVDSLIDRRLLLLEADKSRLQTSDNALREVISKIPALQDNGQFRVCVARSGHVGASIRSQGAPGHHASAIDRRCRRHGFCVRLSGRRFGETAIRRASVQRIPDCA